MSAAAVQEDVSPTIDEMVAVTEEHVWHSIPFGQVAHRVHAVAPRDSRNPIYSDYNSYSEFKGVGLNDRERSD